MIVEHIVLRDFRNYQNRTISFSPTTTIIVGPNASGKTNIIESLHLLATGKSFRAESDREMIAFGKDMTRIKGKINSSTHQLINPSTNKPVDDSVTMKQINNETKELEIAVTSGIVNGVKTPTKRYLVNGVARRGIDFIGNVRSVLFWPQNLELVTESPSIRRRYLDSVLIQVDREYRRSLGTYEKAMRQRNRLLEMIREGAANRNQLVYWDNLLIRNGSYITANRAKYIAHVNRYQIPHYPHYQLAYDTSVISEERLAQYKDQEIAAGVTFVGPHRDDMSINIKDQISKIKNKEELRDMKQYGSRGEQRLAVLWLALCELGFIEEETGDRPVLLLDDMFSELDLGHRKLMIDVIGKQQTIMTTTDLEFVDPLLREKSLIHTLT